MAEFAGCHAFDADKQVVQTAGAGKACVKRRIEDGGLLFFQYRLGMFYTDILEKFFRADSCPVREQPLEMVGTQMDLAGDLVETGLRPEIFPDIVDRFGDPVIIYFFLLFHVCQIYNTKVALRRLLKNPVLAELNRTAWRNITRLSTISVRLGIIILCSGCNKIMKITFKDTVALLFPVSSHTTTPEFYCNRNEL
jgi:hypothetical protein